MRLGLGEYEHVERFNISTFIVRDAFFEKIEALAPQVITSLEQGPLKTYRELWPKRKELVSDWRLIERMNIFYTALLEWSRTWNLDADWCRNRAIDAMAESLDWQELGEDRPLLFNVRDYDFSPEDVEDYHRMVSPPPPPSDLPEWIVVFETRGQYLARIEEIATNSIKKGILLNIETSRRNEAINSVIDNAKTYTNRVSVYFISQPGWRKVKEKPMISEHLGWAVQYQVLERDANVIAKAIHKQKYRGTKYNPREADKITKALERLEPLLGLEFRPSARGPRGSEELEELNE
jgi:hypothetical protein